VKGIPARLTPPRWAQVLGLALLALSLRLVYVWQVHGSSLVQPEELDPGFYYNWAKEIASGAWLGNAPFVQSPLYAYLLGLLMKIPVVGTHVGRILFVQALVGCGTVLLTYVAGRRLFDHTRGLVAGVLIALYGPFLFEEGMIMKTFLSPFLTILLVILLDRARERAEGQAGATGGGRGPAGAFALAGAVYGLTTLDRDNFILLAPVLAALALVLGGGWSRRGRRAAGAFALGTALVVLPVTARNWAVSHEFVLLTTGGGEVFFIGNNADANGLYVPPAFVRPDPKYEHADFIDRASEVSGRTLTPMQSSWFWFREGVRFIASSPLSWSGLVLRKLFYFWNYYELPDNVDYEIMQRFSPLLDYLNRSLPPGGWPTLALPFQGGWVPVRLHLLLTFGSLAPFGLAGIYLARRSWRRLLPLYVLLFGYMGTVLLFFNFSRFRAPVVPILSLFAAECVLAAGRWLKRLVDLAIAFAARSGEMAARARALLPGREGRIACALLAVLGLGMNVEPPRGVVPAIEQALVMGNAYYEDGKPDEALRSYMLGLVLLGEGPSGAEGERLLQSLGPGVTQERLARELEVESVARGPQFKGIHVGIHHGLGIAWLLKGQQLLERGDRPAAMPLLDRAIAQFSEALRIVPSYELSLRKIARAYDLKGDHATALDYMKKASELWPDDLTAALELAEALFNGGDFKGSLAVLDQVSRVNAHLEPHDLSHIYMDRGLVFDQGLGQPGRALYCFEKALELDPQHPQADEIRKIIVGLRARGLQPLPDEPTPASRP
jgi:tetratricopeptide (TPR) repeat protein